MHKGIARARLRRAVFPAVCVPIPVGLLRLKARDEYPAAQFAALADGERLYAERRPVAGPEERAWIREASAYAAMVNAEYECAAKYRWRPLPTVRFMEAATAAGVEKARQFLSQQPAGGDMRVEQADLARRSWWHFW